MPTILHSMLQGNSRDNAARHRLMKEFVLYVVGNKYPGLTWSAKAIQADVTLVENYHVLFPKYREAVTTELVARAKAARKASYIKISFAKVKL